MLEVRLLITFLQSFLSKAISTIIEFQVLHILCHKFFQVFSVFSVQLRFLLVDFSTFSLLSYDVIIPSRSSFCRSHTKAKYRCNYKYF